MDNLGSRDCAASFKRATTWWEGLLLAGPAHLSKNPAACCCIQRCIRSLMFPSSPPGVPLLLPVATPPLAAGGGGVGYGRRVGRDFLSAIVGIVPEGIKGEELEVDAELDESWSSLRPRKVLRIWRFPFLKMSDNRLWQEKIAF